MAIQSGSVTLLFATSAAFFSRCYLKEQGVNGDSAQVLQEQQLILASGFEPLLWHYCCCILALCVQMPFWLVVWWKPRCRNSVSGHGQRAHQQDAMMVKKDCIVLPLMSKAKTTHPVSAPSIFPCFAAQVKHRSAQIARTPATQLSLTSTKDLLEMRIEAKRELEESTWNE
jgi:hypothetical protein